jgi:hypothetical protein
MTGPVTPRWQGGVRDYKKTRFPTRLVYGGGGAEPTLRVITFSDFSVSIGHHIGNEVVFARLTAVRNRHGNA